MSIEMIEAVGANYLDTYLAKCASLLEDHGAMLLQAITIQDQFYAQARKSVDFIQRFIFPSSFIPSIGVIGDSLARVTDLKIFHLEDIGPHYATTLRHWRERFFREPRRGAPPRLLRGRLRRAPARRRAVPADQTRLPARGARYNVAGRHRAAGGHRIARAPAQDRRRRLHDPGCRLPNARS